MKFTIYDCYECKFFNSDACLICSLGTRFSNKLSDEKCMCSENCICNFCENNLYQGKD